METIEQLIWDHDDDYECDHEWEQDNKYNIWVCVQCGAEAVDQEEK